MAHPTRYTLERLLAEDLGTEQRATVEEHLRECQACSAELRALQADEEAFRREVPYAAFRMAHEERRQAHARPTWLRLWLPGLATAAAVAGAVLVMLLPSHGTRIKGGSVALTFSVQEGGTLRPGITGETLAPGARLQLAYEAGETTHMAVVGLDAAGSVSRYFPETGATLAALPAGAKGNLPFSLTLDDALGTERFIAVFAERAAPLAGLMRAVGAVRGTDPALVGDLDLPPGFSQSSIWIRKQ